MYNISYMKRAKNKKNKVDRIDTNERANWLRAAVLGSNDGIISIAGLVIGVSGATQSKEAILTAGIAGIVAGAISLGAGEYVSVKSQRDLEDSLLAKERKDLKEHPREEFEDLVSAYEDDGLDQKDAEVVAGDFTKANAFAVHADVDYHIDSKHLTSAWSSVIASAVSFVIGALVPLLAILLSTGSHTLAITFLAVIIALIVTGALTARVSKTSVIRSVLRVVAGGIIAMSVTYVIGSLFGTNSIAN